MQHRFTASSSASWLLSLFFLSLLFDNVASLSQSINRRDALAIAGGTGFAILLPESASAENEGPIAVLGASGRTGALCVTACLDRGIPVRALTRSGTWQMPTGTPSDNKNNNLLSVTACDVKDPAALEQSIKGCRAVIYAASASKQGGNAKAIDNDGVVAAGNACLKGKIPRYVVLSSTATTRPKSLGYIFTNLSVGGIMDEKRKGEEGVINTYSETATSVSSFTIVRPGGLEEPKRNEVLGASTLEISQGDFLAGIISRADLAEATVELALSKVDNLRNTALELYYTESAKPCESRFKTQLKDGIRLHGDTYEELFRGLKPNVDYYEV
jgi:uncharacterized protein YbjT (DUF2867 family)